jgi:hypothetical protein
MIFLALYLVAIPIAFWLINLKYHVSSKAVHIWAAILWPLFVLGLCIEAFHEACRGLRDFF